MRRLLVCRTVEQKELFGESARRLPYVECSTGGERSRQASVCQAAGMDVTTWIIGGQRFQEVLTLTRLAELTGSRRRRRLLRP